MLVRNIQAVWASPSMAVPKRDTFRLVSDYQAVNSQVEQSPGVMPHQEDMRELLGAKCFGKLDLLQGIGRCPWLRRPKRSSLSSRPKVCLPRLVFHKEY